MSVTQDQVVEYISNLKLGEVQHLIKTLEDTLGVEANAPVAMMAPGAGAEAEEAQTEFDVILTSFGDKKIAVIKAVRALTGLGLKEAKSLVETKDAKIKEGVSEDEAKETKATLDETGASVEIK